MWGPDVLQVGQKLLERDVLPEVVLLHIPAVEEEREVHALVEVAL